MPEYLLPCTCGSKTVVSSVQAGETIRCACGAELQVPSMRGLRDLDAADASQSRRKAAGRWEDRHRMAFLLLVASLLCLGMAGYLWISMPRIERPIAAPTSEVEIATPLQAFQIYLQALQGLPATEESTEDKTRQQMTWGICLAVALAAMTGAGAAIVGLKPARNSSKPKARGPAR